MWMEEKSLQSTSISGYGYESGMPYPVIPHCPALPNATEDDDLQEALKMSIECADNDKRLQAEEAEELIRAIELSAHSACEAHQLRMMETEDLARAIELSASSHARSIEASILATCIEAATASNNSSQQPLAVLDSGEEAEYVLKAVFDNDVRRLCLSWSSSARMDEVSSAIHSAVGESFGLPMTEHYLKYEDADGDMCTLVTETAADYLSSCRGYLLKKLCVWHVPAKGLTAEAAATEEQTAAATRIQALVRGNQSRKELSQGNPHATEAQRHHAATCIQALFRGNHARKMVEGLKVQYLMHEVQQFSMVTPPVSPRGGSANMVFATSIEDEYEDDYIAWTFVPQPTE